MAAVAGMSTMRYSLQPFAISKVWNLNNSRYCQNDIKRVQPTRSNPLKRSYRSSGLDDGDFEDIDHAHILPPLKKVKYEFDSIIQLGSPSCVLTTKDTTTLRAKHPLPSARRIGQVHNSAEVVRVPTGCLPAKSSGHLSIRRKAFRINLPHISNISAQKVRQPFLMDARLSGAVISSLPNIVIKPRYMRDDTVPTGWKFNVYEDTKNEEMENLLIHSATTLDISEARAVIVANANQEKENVSKMDDTGRRPHKTDRTRTPLGNLDVAELFAEGCDVDSYFTIPAE